ncbi:NADPH-dependent FMN reductase [Plantactinospora sp. GCM10030261]|uniref:NADPH-dependent FMN reductase n=1 Tax=Plantactinospora sp. GCM10030261 TaxID=3273420 RepID=UPI003609D682
MSAEHLEIDGPLRIAVIIASTRKGRFGETVGRWFVARAEQHDDLKLDVIDLYDIPLPDNLEQTAQVTALTARVGAADAFVLVTPEYNHGYPAALKRAIDAVRSEWQAKPVGFVSYGGLAGGLRAVEQLRQVFAEVHAVGIRETVSFHLAHNQFNPHGELINPHTANTAAAKLLRHLTWWAQALRAARAAQPYPA